MARRPFLSTRTLAPSQRTFKVAVDQPTGVNVRQSDDQLPEQHPDDRPAEQHSVLEKSEQVVFVVVEDEHKNEVAAVAARVNDVPKANDVRMGAVPQVCNLSLASRAGLVSEPRRWLRADQRVSGPL